MAALIVTADNEYKENNRNVNRCVEELKHNKTVIRLNDGEGIIIKD